MQKKKTEEKKRRIRLILTERNWNDRKGEIIQGEGKKKR